MRIAYILGAVLALAIAQQAQAQFATLESRYINACLKAGDPEPYCRCEFEIARERATLAQLEHVIAIAELPEEARQTYIQKLTPDEIERILKLADEIEAIAAKQCAGR